MSVMEQTLKQGREESRTFMFSQLCYSEEGNILMGLHLPGPCSKGIFWGIEQPQMAFKEEYTLKGYFMYISAIEDILSIDDPNKIFKVQ